MSKQATQILIACYLILLMGSASSVQGGILVFTDRAAWRAAAGGGVGNLTQDFNSFSSDVNWNSSPASAGFLTISKSGTSASSLTRIDAAPFEESGLLSIDGTTFSTLRTNPLIQSNYDFSVPVSAVGFDYRMSSNPALAHITGDIAFQTTLGDHLTLGETIAPAFFGLVYDAGETITDLTFQFNVDRVAGSDNWEAFAAVPEPSSIALLAIGLALTGLSRRFPRRRPRNAGGPAKNGRVA